jgi:hypothetical protein
MPLDDEFTPELALIEAIVQRIIAGPLAEIAVEASVSPSLSWHVRAQGKDTASSAPMASDWLGRLMFRHTYRPNRTLICAQIRLAKPHKTGFTQMTLRGEFDPTVPVVVVAETSRTLEYNTTKFREWK